MTKVKLSNKVDPDPRVGIHIFIRCLLPQDGNRKKFQKINTARENLLAAKCTHSKIDMVELKSLVGAAMPHTEVTQSYQTEVEVPER
jgi:hypothetical protein